jgi:hypothetical protein
MRQKRISLPAATAAAAACGAIGVFLTFSAPIADAGIYHVYSCRTPGGAPAPIDGWTAVIAKESAYDTVATNGCEGGKPLVAALGASTSHVADHDRASWVFTTPSFARLVDARLTRSGEVSSVVGRGTYEIWLSTPTFASVVEECVASLGCTHLGEPLSPDDSANTVELSASRLGQSLWLSASCGGISEEVECAADPSGPSEYAAAMRLSAADLTLEQSKSPVVEAVEGDLATADPVAGAPDVRFTANDAGSGVYTAIVDIDGQQVSETVLDSNGGHCVNVGETTDGAPAFLYLRPCAETVHADVSVPTTGLTNGTHHIQVFVTDAAGNVTAVIDRQVVVDNAPAASAPLTVVHGQLRAVWRRNGSTSLTVPFGRAPQIVGRLVGPSGEPIADAAIEAVATPTAPGARSAAFMWQRTNAAGDFTLSVPRGASSREITLEYSADGRTTRTTASANLALRVHAGVALAVSPRVSGVGREIRFTGRLLGGPVPAGGKAVILQARAPGGHWIDFEVVDAGAAGRFTDTYRFRFPGPAHYEFRAVSEREAAYPYLSGASPVVGVFER